jgi:hypothetical protein
VSRSSGGTRPERGIFESTNLAGIIEGSLVGFTLLFSQRIGMIDPSFNRNLEESLSKIVQNEPLVPKLSAALSLNFTTVKKRECIIAPSENSFAKRWFLRAEKGLDESEVVGCIEGASGERKGLLFSWLWPRKAFRWKFKSNYSG